MADRKKSTKTADKSLDLSNLSLPEQLQVKRAELLTTQKSLYAGTLQNPHAIKSIKKDIARILTQLNQANVTNQAKGAN